MLAMKLLLVAASVAATSDNRVKVDWDRTLPTNKLIYDIQLQQDLINEMQNGKEINGAVPATVTTPIQFFRISVTPRTSGMAPDSPLKRDETLRQEPYVDYGWRVGNDGRMEYLIQIRPTRLQSLVNGMPIEGEVDIQAGDVRHFLVFVGDDPNLPHEDPRTGAPAPLRSGGTSAFNSIASGIRGSSSSSRGFDSRSTFRRGSNYIDEAPQYRGSSSFANNSRGVDDVAVNYGPTNSRIPYERNYQDGYGAVTNPAAIGSNYQGNNGYGAGLNNNIGNGAGVGGGFAGNGLNGNNGGLANNTAYGNNANNQNLQYANNASRGMPAGLTAQQQEQWLQLNSAVAAAALPKSPSIILTALGLFVSLGFNAYLAWLAWTFFWRYREVASELARARTDAISPRQFA